MRSEKQNRLQYQMLANEYNRFNSVNRVTEDVDIAHI